MLLHFSKLPAKVCKPNFQRKPWTENAVSCFKKKKKAHFDFSCTGSGRKGAELLEVIIKDETVEVDAVVVLSKFGLCEAVHFCEVLPCKQVRLCAFGYFRSALH